MAGAVPRLALIPALLIVATACSGPTRPSPAAPATQPSSPVATAHGTIALVSATPAPGTELVVDLAGSKMEFSASFSVALDAAVANAAVELQMLDGASQICGSGTSEPQNLAAGETKTFSVAVTALSCAPPATVENLKATLVTGTSAQRTEYLDGTFPAHYALRPPPGAAMSLSGTVNEPGHGALAGARVDVEDGPNTGKATTTDGAGRYVLTGLTAGTFTVRASKDGYDNSHIRVTLAATSVTQDFAIARSPSGPPSSGSGAFTFVGSNPAPGGEMSLVDSAGLLLLPLRVELAIRFETTLPDAKVEVELLNDAGQQCAYGFVDQPITANQSITAVNTFWNWEGQRCGAYPIGTTTLKATLLTLRGPEQNGRLQRTDYAISTFPSHYTIRRYPPPPGGPETPPTISDLTWKVNLPVGGDPPIAGDPVTIACTARETDGAPLTTTITLTWDTLAPQRYTEVFPAGASSSPSGARHAIGVSAPNIGPGALHARVDCVTTNDRGQSASKTTDIGTAK